MHMTFWFNSGLIPEKMETFMAVKAFTRYVECLMILRSKRLNKNCNVNKKDVGKVSIVIFRLGLGGISNTSYTMIVNTLV